MHAMLSALGALTCLDYTTQDVEAEAPSIAGRQLDAVADFVGGETLAQSLAVIRPYGRPHRASG